MFPEIRSSNDIHSRSDDKNFTSVMLSLVARLGRTPVDRRGRENQHENIMEHPTARA